MVGILPKIFERPAIHTVLFPIKNGINCCNFWTGGPIRVSPFDKMLFINEAFSLFWFGFQEVADELLGMPGSDKQMNS